MIDVKKKEDCVGCGACVQRCPKSCIKMCKDEQGFLYSKVNLELCVDCHLCERVCPVINQAEPRKPVRVYVAKNTNEAVRLASSSGGIFFALAKYVIDKGGVVFGARFNDKWEVVHSYAETIEGIKAFQGSKYVQSRISGAYRQAETFLKAGRMVMFTGTPCQLAGLRLFLRKDYHSLLAIDIACHGVPSPKVWSDYLAYLLDKYQSQGNSSTIKRINFRDKRKAWDSYGLSVQIDDFEFYESCQENLYMRSFLSDMSLRPSCYNCPAKNGKSHSDITLADSWGIKILKPQLYDKSGVSLVLINAEKGLQFFRDLKINSESIDFNKALEFNSSLIRSTVSPKKRQVFWDCWANNDYKSIMSLVSLIKVNLLKRIWGKIRIYKTKYLI